MAQKLLKSREKSLFNLGCCGGGPVGGISGGGNAGGDRGDGRNGDGVSEFSRDDGGSNDEDEGEKGGDGWGGV